MLTATCRYYVLGSVAKTSYVKPNRGQSSDKGKRRLRTMTRKKTTTTRNDTIQQLLAIIASKGRAK